MNKLPTIALDMDGTIADLYNVPRWLDRILANDATPYYVAGELIDLDYLNDLLTLYKALGGHVCVISWGRKGMANGDALRALQAAKILWMRENLPSVDDIRVVAYGTPKSRVATNVQQTVLFDDEEPNRMEFMRAGGKARLPKNLFRFLLAAIENAC